MKTAHTPGPWRAESRSMCDGSLVVKDAEHNELCTLLDRSERGYTEEDRRAVANATLMADAPAMLDTIEQCFVALGRLGANTTENPVGRKEWERCRDILAAHGRIA